jgi:uncharacterized protein
MGEGWLRALGLVLVIEALLPLMAPATWRDSMARLARLRDGQLRFLGLLALLAGFLLVWL